MTVSQPAAILRSEAVGIAREARDDPVLSVVLDRAEAGSLPGRRSDGCVVSAGH